MKTEELPPNSNLPPFTAELIGRDGAVAEIIELLRGPARLVTLTGPGGIGKTRLALEAASRLVDDFRDGVYLVELAAIREPELVLPEIARVLDVKDGGALLERLRGRRLLLVLDNLEQIVDAAPPIAELLAASSTLRVLATSRAPLRRLAEHAYPVDPLALDQAVALFIERARSVAPLFEPDRSLPAICERLDCLPLAVELAAARARTLPPTALAERLERSLPLLVGGPRDLPDRQRTLRATIEWSYELLEEPERSLFPRVAVFRGSWTPEDAQQIADADAPALETLVDEGLLRREGNGSVRYSMLETVRELAEELLGRDSAAADRIRRRHAEHLLSLAEEARPFARGPKEKEWLERLELELDNIRAALRYCIERGDAMLGLTLAEALEPLWVRRFHHREGVRWLEALLELPDEAPAPIRAGALGIAARLTVELGDAARAKPWYRQSLELARNAGDEPRAAWALHGLGHVAFQEGQLAEARRRFEQSLELFDSLGEDAPAGGRLTYLAAVAQAQGDLAAAGKYLERAQDHYAAAGDLGGVAAAIHGRGDLALEDNDPEGALAFYGEALDKLQSAWTSFDLAYNFAGIAGASAALGRRAEAARLWGVVERLDAELEVKVERGQYERVLGELGREEVAVGAKLDTREALAFARELSRVRDSAAEPSGN